MTTNNPQENKTAEQLRKHLTPRALEAHEAWNMARFSTQVYLMTAEYAYREGKRATYKELIAASRAALEEMKAQEAVIVGERQTVLHCRIVAAEREELEGGFEKFSQ